MTIKEKCLERRQNLWIQKLVNNCSPTLKTDPNLAYIALFKKKKSAKNVLIFHEALPIWRPITSPLKYVVYLKRLWKMSESFETMNSGRFGNRSAIFLENSSPMTAQWSLHIGILRTDNTFLELPSWLWTLFDNRFVVRDLRRSGCRQKIANSLSLPSSLPLLSFSVSIQNSLSYTSDSYLKSVRA